MEVYEKINLFIKQKKITKREFAKILRDLEPRLKSTDQPPIETTIYKYLNGQVSIPIELISYIAEALDITEQELFDINTNTRIKLLKYISKGLDTQQLFHIENLSSKSTIINRAKTNYEKNSNATSNHKQEIEKLFSLMEYAPQAMIKKMIKKLEEIKKIALEEI